MGLSHVWILLLPILNMTLGAIKMTVLLRKLENALGSIANVWEYISTLLRLWILTLIPSTQLSGTDLFGEERENVYRKSLAFYGRHARC